ncbi:MAG: nucleotidyltransferase domain-containing protein [Proteobacteria bacterium]|nr:nucleotidyltransferase domain-containing protein [Pseudomonadota bacterium]
MKTIDQVQLSPNQLQALAELRKKLFGSFGIEAINFFGSVVRGEADEESDIDLLIVTRQTLKRPVRHQITDIVFEINLKYDTNFSTLVVDRNSWESGVFSILPLRDEILRDGVAL